MDRKNLRAEKTRLESEDVKTCPKCGESWEVPGTIYSRLIGIEVRGGYDGVNFWECPDCHTRWSRWTGAEVTDLFFPFYKGGKI